MKRSPLFTIFLIVLVDVMALTIIIPLLPFYAQSLGASPAVVGTLFSCFAVCQLIAGPILGQLSDRYGRRPVLLVSQMGTFCGLLLLAFANQLWLLFVARIIDGITAGNLSVAQAYISDVTEPENRAKSFGLIGIAFGLGFLIGPTIPAFLIHFGYAYPILFAAFLSLLSVLGTYFFLPNPEHQIKGGTQGTRDWFPWNYCFQAFRNPALAPFMWQFLCFIFTFAMFIGGFGLFAERRFTINNHPFTAKEVGYLFAYVGFLGIIVQGFFMGKLVKRFGETKLVRMGFLYIVAGALLLGLVQTVPFLVVAITLSFFGSSLLRPSLTSLITQKIDRSEQGKALGLTQSLTSMAQISAPVLGGLLIQNHYLGAWAWTGAVVSYFGFLLSRKRPAAA